LIEDANHDDPMLPMPMKLLPLTNANATAATETKNMQLTLLCITTNVLPKNRPLIFQDLFSTLVVLSSILALLYSTN
jgi:hypothetical protein